ncbi:hypothetical protein ACIQYS_17650 [Psychrobacillus sp. NPDC096426]|uniref:hypothetical protein n=1 Tax=Psychrobacillus sp. NPDC096426 TaxID=3364491 RepID=UPI00381B10B2
MTRNKIIKPILLLLIMVFTVIGCANKEEEEALTKVTGIGLSYSEYFKSVDAQDERKNVAYYMPLPIDEMLNVAPNSIQNTVHPIDPKKLPFEVNEQKAYLVTSINEKGNLQNQLQFTYLHNNEYEQPEEFFILSVTEVDENPLDKYDFSKEQADTVGNELRKEKLIDDIPIFHQVITTDGALTYRYYSFDEKEKRLVTVVTTANELYGYYNDYLYHVGYSTKNNNKKEVQDKIFQLTRAFIMGDGSLNE